MSAYLMSDQMLLQASHYNPTYQQLMMRAAMCNYTEPQTPVPEELECEMELLNTDLWKQFHNLGTEMIITKNGRRMFPSLSVQVKGLTAGEQYAIAVEMVPLGGARWRRAGGVWAAGGTGMTAGGILASQGAAGVALHPDGPAPASRWSLPINFNRLKLTNNVHDTSGNIVLTSMCKYQPRIRVMRVGGGWPAEKCFTFPETEFIAVTAYQNEQITQLKIDNNPFAKGFRKCGQGRCKRKMRSLSPDGENKSEENPTCKMRHDNTDNASVKSVESQRPGSPEHSSSDRSNASSPALDMSLRSEECRIPALPYEEHIDVIGCDSSTSSRSPARSPSLSSESSYQQSVSSSHHEDHKQNNHHNDAVKYNNFQVPDWTSMLYGRQLWMPPHFVPPSYVYPSTLPISPFWHHSPSIKLPSSPSPPTPACRPRDTPKGSTFTIRALIGEN